MKPTEWTPLERVRFFELLMNDEYVLSPALQEEFFTIKDFMEKEMPEVWNQYLYETHGNVWLSTKGWKRYDVILNAQLSLDNLLSFLMENTEMWGWEECEYMKEWPRILPNGGSAFFCEKQCKDKPINCNGGKVKHPALLYAESVKEKPCEKR